MYETWKTPFFVTNLKEPPSLFKQIRTLSWFSDVETSKRNTVLQKFLFSYQMFLSNVHWKEHALKLLVCECRRNDRRRLSVRKGYYSCSGVYIYFQILCSSPPQPVLNPRQTLPKTLLELEIGSRCELKINQLTGSPIRYAWSTAGVT